jgi:hypothetical protein
LKKTITYWENNTKRLMTILCVCVTPIMAGVLTTGCAGDRYHESTGESIDDTEITARAGLWPPMMPANMPKTWPKTSRACDKWTTASR